MTISALRPFLLVLALAAPLAGSAAAAAPAQAPNWTTILKVGTARSQACKVPVDGGRAWQVRARLVNGEDQSYFSTYSVSRGDKTLSRVRLVADAGSTSATKKLEIRRGPAFTLGASLGSAEGALGDSNVLAGVPRC